MPLFSQRALTPKRLKEIDAVVAAIIGGARTYEEVSAIVGLSVTIVGNIARHLYAVHGASNLRNLRSALIGTVAIDRTILPTVAASMLISALGAEYCTNLTQALSKLL